MTAREPVGIPLFADQAPRVSQGLGVLMRLTKTGGLEPDLPTRAREAPDLEQRTRGVEAPRPGLLRVVPRSLTVRGRRGPFQ